MNKLELILKDKNNTWIITLEVFNTKTLLPVSLIDILKKKEKKPAKKRKKKAT
jgi:hypothetical protein